MVKIPNFSFEKSLLPKNCRYLLGIDEVGRGPWAGPVAVGAFLIDIHKFDLEFFIKNQIRDSKSLTAGSRQKILKELEKQNYSYDVVFADSTEIDKIGIQSTIYLLIEKLLNNFSGNFDFALIDGNLKIESKIAYRSVVKADNKCFSVAAASICAKVLRDQKMDEYEKIYQGYGFKDNKGYGTKNHLIGLQKQGPCPIHRFSYKPIKKFLESYSSSVK